MRFRYTLILGLLCAALGAYLLFADPEPAGEEEKREKLFDLAGEDITAVTLTYPDRKLAVEKRDGKWQLTEPMPAPGDQVMVQNMVNAIANFEVTKRLEDPATDLAPYGLDKPEVVIDVQAGERVFASVRVGKKAPIGHSIYLQLADNPSVILAPERFRIGVDKQMKDLRDKKFFVVEESEVQKIIFQRPEQRLVMTKSNDTWLIEEPISSAADPEVVTRFLSSVSGVQALDFPAETASDLSPYGLDAPRLQLSVLVGKDGEDKTLLFGNDTADMLAVYTKFTAQPNVYTIADWAFVDLDKDLNDFRDKTVLPFEKDEVTRIDVRRAAGGAFTLQRGEDQSWSLEGAAGAVDKAKVEELLSNLDELEGYEIVTDPAATPAAYALAEPKITVTLHGSEGVIGTARVSSHQPDPASTEYTAVRQGEPTVYRIRQHLYEELERVVRYFALPAPTNGG